MSSSLVLLQNKCFRYWPDKGCTKEYGCISVHNVSEREAQGYYLRELEISRTDRVSPLLGLPAGLGWAGAGTPGEGAVASLFCYLMLPLLKFWATLPQLW